MNDFSGVWTALITPMNDDESVNYADLESLVERQIEGRVSGIVPVGTTGESPTLDTVEHLEVIKHVCKTVGGRIPVVAGTGSNSTREAVHLTREADEAGADAFLVVAPYYNKPTQEGVFLHFSKIAECTQKPIFLYSIPGRCGIGIENDTVLRLREKFPNICVLKEAGGKAEKVADLHSRAADSVSILSGDDGLTLDFMDNGAVGVVSVASNIIPAQMSEMVGLYLKGEKQRAREISDRLKDLFKNLFVEPNPVPAKFAAMKTGLINSDCVRLPLCRMTEEHKALLTSTLENLNLIK